MDEIEAPPPIQCQLHDLEKVRPDTIKIGDYLGHGGERGAATFTVSRVIASENSTIAGYWYIASVTPERELISQMRTPVPLVWRVRPSRVPGLITLYAPREQG